MTNFLHTEFKYQTSQLGGALRFPNYDKNISDRVCTLYQKYNEELVSLKIGERSAYYSLKYGVQLSDEEYQAIINYDITEADKQAKWYGGTLSTILKQANDLAIIEEKNNSNGN